jgi:Ca2+-binding RTX toxin-like protein
MAAITPVTNDAAGANALADVIEAAPGNVSSASFDAVPTGGSGTPHGTADAPLSFFPTADSTFGILTTGNVELADDPNTAASSGEDLSGPNVRGDTDLDVTVLKFGLDAPQGSNCVALDFGFYSEEFPEFVGRQFNDAFIAELDTSTWTTSGSVITAPDNFAFDPTTGGEISVNTSGPITMTGPNAAGTTYDGATPLLSAATPITPGAHTLFLSIFDQADRIFDSAVFLDNLVIGFVPNPAQNCVPGAEPKQFSLSLDPPTAENPVGKNHTVTATLTEEPSKNPVDAAPIGFTVTGANSASGTATTGPDGKASFTYAGASGGQDTVSACYDPDADGTCEALASATKNWIDQCAGETATIVGTNGNDTIAGTSGPDVIQALGGDDEVSGLSENDLICGGGGDDELRGNNGEDRLRGGSGDDELRGGNGDDRLAGGRGDDHVRGDLGNDRVSGGSGNDDLSGGPGDDRLRGGAGNDDLSGDSGQDRLFGGDGNDSLDGGFGTDLCDGGGLGTDTDTGVRCEVSTDIP